MENFYLAALIEEIKPQLLGRKLSSVAISAKSAANLILDFHLSSAKVLKASFEPAISALYLDTPQRRKENEAHLFASTVGKSLVGLWLIAIHKPLLDRVVQLDFAGNLSQEDKPKAKLFLSLSGRSANAYLTNAENRIEAMLKKSKEYDLGDQFQFPNSLFSYTDFLKSQSYESKAESLPPRLLETIVANSQIRQEYQARAESLPANQALESLVKDLTTADPQPTIYSSENLQHLLFEVLRQKPLLMLSHFPLQAFTQKKDIHTYNYKSLSDAASLFYYYKVRIEERYQEFNSLQRLLDEAIKKVQRQILGLEDDYSRFKDPERLKKYGDLLLANLSTAKVFDTIATVIDYYDDNQPLIEIQIGENQTLQQAATEYFSRYQKSRRALEVIASRENSLRPQLDYLNQLSIRLAKVTQLTEFIEIKDEIESRLGIRLKVAKKSPSTINNDKREGRWFQSTTGHEIVVGKNDRDNDAITFRLARPQDIWLHAADYPGSHVIIRNPRREEVPNRTILEAAEIAAFYSQAKTQNKVAVHYTLKKFVTKPPRAKAGLVRLSSFKTILVEPRCNLQKVGS